MSVEFALTDRWTTLRPHKEQQRLWRSEARFKVVPAGRRSGKSEISKRKIVRKGMGTAIPDARYIAAAPTFAQAKKIFWRDLQVLIPDWYILNINRTELEITLKNGASIQIHGLDKPERIEGSPLHGIVVDEIANCPPDSWKEHIRPCLSDTNGWAMLIGVPEGRNFYHKLYMDGVAKKNGEWDSFTWHSADIIPASEIAAVREEMDARTFRQEYEGSFETFDGRAYYDFSPSNVRELQYDPRLDLIFCFDFNTSPGVAVVAQEQEIGTCVIGEVWIERDSNTPMVCSRLVRKWKHHTGIVICRGDQTGGVKKTSSVAGSDWEIIRDILSKAFPGATELDGRRTSRLRIDLPSGNPPERERLNAMNARIKSASGERRLFVDGARAPHTMADLDSVESDNAGCLVKKKKPHEAAMLTHPTDALGYHVWRKYPLKSGTSARIRRHF